MIDYVISWYTLRDINLMLNNGLVRACTQTQVVESLITTHFPPPPRVNIQDPCILQRVAIVIHSPSDQQLGVILSKVEAAGCMGVSPHWPKSSLSLLKFGPLLKQVIHKKCYMKSSVIHCYAHIGFDMAFHLIHTPPTAQLRQTSGNTSCIRISLMTERYGI